MENKLKFKAKLWLYPGMAGNWCFASLPQKEGRELKETFSGITRGWGSLRVKAKIGKTEWKTSIFPDKKQGTYLLPIKAEVRKKEQVEAGNEVEIEIEILI